MNRKFNYLITALLILSSLSVFNSQIEAAPGDPVNIPDTNFRQCINDSLGNLPADIPTEGEMASIVNLDCNNRNITSIEGAEYLTGVSFLFLGTNQITDISYLSGLTTIQLLNLTGNQISDITPLSNLTNLSILLNLDNNPIADLSPISGLTSLTTLDLDGTQTSDISALANLTSLTFLSLANNEITSIDALSNLTSLQTLYLNGNEISDITVLSNLTDLVNLYLDNNHISDISSLNGLSNLSNLTLDGQTVTLQDEIINVSTYQIPEIVIGADGSIVPYDSNPLESFVHNETKLLTATWNEDFIIGGAIATFNQTVQQTVTYHAPLLLDGNGFTISVDDAKNLTDELAKANANVSSSRDGVDLIDSVTVDQTQLNNIKNATSAGTYSLAFTIVNDGETMTLTIEVMVTATTNPTLPPTGMINGTSIVLLIMTLIIAWSKKIFNKA